MSLYSYILNGLFPFGCFLELPGLLGVVIIVVLEEKDFLLNSHSGLDSTQTLAVHVHRSKLDLLFGFKLYVTTGHYSGRSGQFDIA